MNLKITVDGKMYEVEVEVAESEAPAMPGYVPPQARVSAGPPRAPVAVVQATDDGPAVNEDKVCRSPIAGTVVRVSARAGQQIKPGDVLLVLEAMKMETNITAPMEGKVARVVVNAGETVQGGKILVEFE